MSRTSTETQLSLQEGFQPLPSGTKGAGGATAPSSSGNEELAGWVRQLRWLPGSQTPAQPRPSAEDCGSSVGSLSSLRRRRAVAGGAGSQERSVYICVRDWVGHRHPHADVGDLGRERKWAEHKLSRTSDGSQIKIPDLIPLTSDTFPKKLIYFPEQNGKQRQAR